MEQNALYWTVSIKPSGNKFVCRNEIRNINQYLSPCTFPLGDEVN